MALLTGGLEDVAIASPDAMLVGMARFDLGVACTTTTLDELGGGEPVSLGVFRNSYDNTASEGQGSLAVSVTGSIRSIVKKQSFEVHFDRTSRFIFFARHGARCVKTSGDGELPRC